jgi:iron complex outermembrane receptor protein
MYRSGAYCVLVAAAGAWTVANAADAPEAALDEVVVTATKQGAQNLQNVPIAITAISQQTLQDAGIRDFEDFARRVPGLSFNDNGPGNKQYIIRGVNSNGTGVATVNQYVDEIPITGDLRQPDLQLYDIQRIEVLRGPQGTLYGSSALSGTIRTITNKPDATKFDAAIEGQASYTHLGSENYDGNVMVNLPLIDDRLALRIVAYGDRDSGYIDNIRLHLNDVNEAHTYGGRASLRFLVDSATDLTATVMYQNLKVDGRNFVTATGGSDYNTDQYVHDPFSDHFSIYNFTLNHRFDALALTFSSSYFDRTVIYNFDSTPYDLSFGPGVFQELGFSTADGLTNTFNTSKLFTNEARLATTSDGPFTGVVGLFQQQIKTSLNTYVGITDDAGYLKVPAEPVFGEILDHKTDQYALFGEVGYKFTPQWSALLGLRYFYAEQTDNRRSTFPFGGFSPPYDVPTSHDYENKATPKAYLSYQATPDVMAYATISEGFRIGGSNQDPEVALPPQDRTFGPDLVWNYELGAKSSWLNHRLSVDAAIYYIDWRSIQVADFVATQNNSDTFTGNAGKARVIGAELEVDARPLDGLQLSGTLGYSNAKLTENQPTDDPAFGALNGNRFPLVPELSGSFSAQYSWPLTGLLRGFVRADYSYTGGQGTQFNPGNPLYHYLSAYSLLNGRVGVRAEKYEAALYITNATNHYAINILQEASDHTPLGVVPERPRTIGLDLRYHF